MLRKKTPLSAGEKKQWKKPQEEPQRRDPSSRTDRRAIDVACTEQIHIIMYLLLLLCPRRGEQQGDGDLVRAAPFSGLVSCFSCYKCNIRGTGATRRKPVPA